MKGYDLRHWARGILVTLGMLSGGCMFGGLRVEQVETSVQKPSNVAVYLAVSKGDDPALGLEPAARDHGGEVVDHGGVGRHAGDGCGKHSSCSHPIPP